MASPTDRLIDSLAALVRELLPNVDYLGCYLYSVYSFSESAQTADLRPVGNSKMPTVAKVPIRTPGLQIKLLSGDEVLVAFQDGDPSQPFIASLSTAASYAAALPIARQGDMALSGGNGTLIALYPVAPAPGPLLPATPYLVSFGAVPPLGVPPTPPPLQGMLPGIVSTGSARAKSI